VLVDGLAAAADVLVEVMASDVWEDVRGRFAGFLMRGGGDIAAALELLEHSRECMAAASTAQSGQVRREHEAVWLALLGDVVNRDPGAADELRVLTARVKALLVDSAGKVSQVVVASDHAQVAALGLGIQHVHFGPPPPAEVIPAVQRPEEWVVDRPTEVDQVVTAVLGGGTVAVTTALYGVGGFGKTTVAKMVRSDPRVLDAFGNRVYWVTLGRDTRTERLGGLVNGLIGWIQPEKAGTFPDVGLAADYLAGLLAAGPRRLLILDDVWTEEQLSAFPVAGKCARVVTTRNSSLVLAAGAAALVEVDEMSDAQARALLGAGLPPLPPMVVADLVRETGRWPLLLRLVNKIVADQARAHPDVSTVARELASRLRVSVTRQVDELTGAARQALDVTDQAQRQRAVWATIQASTELLGPAECERLAELAVFAADETIPVTLVIMLWEATAKQDAFVSRALCARLADLALLNLNPVPGGTVAMHGILRDYHREKLGGTRLAQLHEVLLDTAAKTLPADVRVTGPGTVTAWWELPEQAQYLREHLVGHMLEAGQASQAEELATDLRWTAARLGWSGPSGPFTDLAIVGTPRAVRLASVFGQVAHLLAPTDPVYSQADILCSRVSHDPDWGPQGRLLQTGRCTPALINRWPLPDLPNPWLRRTFSGHVGEVSAVEVAPDGAWLAVGGEDGSVRIWDVATGTRRAVLTGHSNGVAVMVVAPDGAWLAVGGEYESVRIWDVATWEPRAVLADTSTVVAPVVAPDGTWLATGGGGGPVRIWDVATWEPRGELPGHNDVYQRPLVVSPDGTWLATDGGDGSVRIWDTAVDEQQAVLASHDDVVLAMAASSDGTWLATGNTRGSLGIWDVATGEQRAKLIGHHASVLSVAVAPDGTWLATGGRDGTARIWDTVTWSQRTVLAVHDPWQVAVAVAPDGTWLATATWDGTARIWDVATGDQRAVLAGDQPRFRREIMPDGFAMLMPNACWDGSVVVAPDGTWLATGSWDGTVRIWDVATGKRRAKLVGHGNGVAALVVAPDGTWLAAGGAGPTRIWDTATWEQRATLTGHAEHVETMAVSPDGNWLASASRDRTVRIWDPATGCVRAVMRTERPLLACTWSPDGESLAVAGGAYLCLFTFVS
jgi:WD40 repeat protein